MTQHRPKLRTKGEIARGDRLPRKNVRLTNEMLRRLRERAERANLSVSGVIRRAIVDLLKREA